jgi:integrase
MATTREFKNSPNGYMVLRRPDRSQANVSCNTSDDTAVALMTNSAQALLDAHDGQAVPMTEILETAENICKLVNKKNSPTVEAIPYLRGLLGEHTGSESHLRAKKRVIGLLEGVLTQDAHPKAAMRDITGDDAGKFKAAVIALGLGDFAVRMYLHTLGGMFETAFKRGIVDENVVRLVNKPPRPKNSPRRPFTDDELRKTFAVADEEWRGMMMVGLYTGLRLGDISRLVFRDIDLATKHIRAAVRKGKRFESKPIPNALLRYFQSRKWPTDLDQPLFPRAYVWATTGCRSIGRISAAFIELLISAGVRTADQRQGHQQRQGAEKYAPLSFHCLRHNFTTMLKKSKVSEAVARGIGGHRSVAVSDVYTHLGEDVMLNAVQSVPNVIDVSARVAKETAASTPGASAGTSAQGAKAT